MVEIEVNDRLGKKVRVKCSPQDTIGDFKKLVAAQIGTDPKKIVLKKWYKEFKDHITLDDCKLEKFITFLSAKGMDRCYGFGTMRLMDVFVFVKKN